MRVCINGDFAELPQGSRVSDIADIDTVAVVDGYAVNSDYILTDGEQIILSKRGSLPDRQLLRQMMSARNGKDVNDRVRKAHVAVCGLGGLGSNIAVSLARLGVGHLTLIDYDIVEPTNLNRQDYYIRDIGRDKSEAMRDRIADINPYIEVNAVTARIDENNVIELIGDADIVVEAFDNAESKAALVGAVIERTDKYIVAASGMAGYGSANSIVTRRIGRRLYMTGDGVSEAKVGSGLMSPRVLVNAGHQANAVLRLIMGITEE